MRKISCILKVHRPWVWHELIHFFFFSFWKVQGKICFISVWVWNSIRMLETFSINKSNKVEGLQQPTLFKRHRVGFSLIFLRCTVQIYTTNEKRKHFLILGILNINKKKFAIFVNTKYILLMRIMHIFNLCLNVLFRFPLVFFCLLFIYSDSQWDNQHLT